MESGRKRGGCGKKEVRENVVCVCVCGEEVEEDVDGRRKVAECLLEGRREGRRGRESCGW